MAMSEDQYKASHPGELGPDGEGKQPWFTKNGAGVGYHPSSWQGVLVLALAVAVLVCIVLLAKGVI